MASLNLEISNFPDPSFRAVPGVIGCLQALEVVKIACNIGSTLAQKLLLFDGLQATFRTVKLRPRVKTCAVCGDEPTVTELIDYEQFCGARPDDKPLAVDILSPHMNIKAAEYNTNVVQKDKPHLLLDVRAPVQYSICSLPKSSSTR
jgi:adenylyltransferase and sulfurtransferase